MSKRAGILSVTSAVAVALMLAVMAPAAGAAFGVSKWEAGTCKSDAPKCTYSSPEAQFFTQAAGHPPVGLTDFAMNVASGLPPIGGAPKAMIKDARVDLPEGLNVDPAGGSAVRQSDLRIQRHRRLRRQPGRDQRSDLRGARASRSGRCLSPSTTSTRRRANRRCSASTVGLPGIPVANVYLVADVAWDSDYHEGFTISDIPTTLPLVENRLVFDGTKGGTFLTMGEPVQRRLDHRPSRSTPTRTRGSSRPTRPSRPGPAGPSTSTAASRSRSRRRSPAAPNRRRPTRPRASTRRPQRPAGPAADSTPRRCDGERLAAARARAQPVLGAGPARSAATPSSARGPKAPVACPANSQIGTVSIETPVLPANSLPAKVFLGQQLSRDPASGNEYRIFVDAESARYGLSVRLIGNVKAEPEDRPADGDFADNPQVAFSSFQLQLAGGAKAPLSSPPICASTTTTPDHAVVGQRRRGADQPADADQSARRRRLRENDGRTPLRARLQSRPEKHQRRHLHPLHGQHHPRRRPAGAERHRRHPAARARPRSWPASPTARRRRSPPRRRGPAARRKPTPAAPTKARSASRRSPPAPAPRRSRSTARSSSPVLIRARRSRWSWSRPALAGPFDLGTVVVRVPLFVDPETAQIHALTDEIPDVFGGAKLDIRSIAVNVNKDDFTLNGTNCSQIRHRRRAARAAAPTRPTRRPSRPSRSPTRSSSNDCDAARLPARS